MRQGLGRLLPKTPEQIRNASRSFYAVRRRVEEGAGQGGSRGRATGVADRSRRGTPGREAETCSVLEGERRRGLDSAGSKLGLKLTRCGAVDRLRAVRGFEAAARPLEERMTDFLTLWPSRGPRLRRPAGVYGR